MPVIGGHIFVSTIINLLPHTTLLVVLALSTSRMSVSLGVGQSVSYI